MNRFIVARATIGATLVWLAASAAHSLDGAVAERAASGEIVLHWRDPNPVDVYVSIKPDAAPSRAKLLVRGDRDGGYRAEWTRPERPYFTLRDEPDRTIVRVAERVVTLERGSNFRDLGGYPTASGRHVRWGMIYRTAAMPMLTDADYRSVSRLGIRSIIDLRSVEERQIAPDGMPAHAGALYLAHDYPADEIFSRIGAPPAGGQNPVTGLYRTWLVSLAPQFRDIFQQLLRRDGAVSYHCSAGQDRTGVATALVLSALGVPRDVIMADYQLSTFDRRPENEIPKLTPGQYPGNIVADFYRRAQASGTPMKARPLYTAAGKPFLQETFEEIDTRWGSVDVYLKEVLGLDQTRIAELRSIYLE
jgi:protein-tyrosine phosphatase